ncbi:hypothetical protein VIBNISOn1_1050050 [Vibrio nigripulchritudo SOn1]|uniref:Uncharacterized protein n=1 Tax=Vibrio nigripulchritudo SOn1 TaxID=1238450 RepID=A0AAV2VIG2_9VIBR|nr:hypothetical protein [Vibrio nigripulchritudo]CCO44224.1 hypothetical protein VIBNISOn1_1050050 [Vibrio nigripulchritudo SOn1]
MDLTKILHLQVSTIENSVHLAGCDFASGVECCPFEPNSPESQIWESTVKELQESAS